MADALDALAPSAQPSAPAPAAPTPATVPAPSSSPLAPPSAAPAPATPTPVAAAPTAPDGPALLRALSEQLGIPADELRESLELTRRMRAEHARRQDLERQADPQYQHRQQRNAALDQLLIDRFGPEVAGSLQSLPQIADYLHSQRADGAQADMVAALGEIGITFDGSKESQELQAEWEDTLTDRINASPRLVQRYNGTPAERREVVRELIGREERRINNVLLRQNAATLRDHAARSASMPRSGRSVTVTPQVQRQVPTATDPLQRTREGRVLDGRVLDDLWSMHH